MPGRRSFGAVGTVVLASGVLIGAAIGPALTPSSLAATAGQLVVVASDPAGAAATATQPGGGGTAGASSALAAPTGNVATPHRVVNSGGAAPAAPIASTANAPSTPAPPTAPDPSPPAPDPTPTTPVEDPSVSGTVVHVSHEGKGYAIATKDGQLIALRTKHAPALGDKLKTTVLPLDNGTFKERKVTSKGHADAARFHGTVTYADPTARVYTVSARGVSLLVTMPPVPPPADPATAPPPPPPPPAVGTLVTVGVTITDTIDEVKREDGDPAAGEVDLEAIVRDPDPANPDPTHLIVSADDAGESPATISLRVPPELDVSKLTPGTILLGTVKREDDGSLTLVSASPDA